MDMKFVVKKEDLYNGIKIVERATSMKALQPVLLNILIETIGNSSIKLVATDLDFTVIAYVDAQVEEEGKITLPSKTLNEIVSKLSDKLITFEMNNEETSVNITCQNSKFDIIGISANEFPPEFSNIEINENDGFEIEIRPFVKAVRQAGFAAASYETSNLLSGIVCDISENILEIASTDGNRLARVRETIDNKDNHAKQLIIPSKTLNEFIKMSSFIDEDSVKIYTENSKLIIKSEKTTTISRLLEGQFPKYNQLIPKESPKEAIVNVSQVISAIERVSIMVNEKTSIVKLEFSNNNLKLSADTPDSGKSEESLDIDYSGEELAIAFNYKYVLEALKNIDADEVKIGLNTPLSATMFRPNSEEDFVGLIMPVQIR
ncbi:TPA: DNA polymerase III subunit beta [Candidatus Gastranaerophilales bacterium HUM_20]|nr:MAG TPA: DNA polymerase III subunit beta [Candidatus Gastranaerophilales bacterium HUM_20]